MQDSLQVLVNNTHWRAIDAEFVSLTMPPRVEQYISTQLHPLFEMNLPEGYLLAIIKKHFEEFWACLQRSKRY